MGHRVRRGSLSALGMTAAICLFIQTGLAQNSASGTRGAETAQKPQLAWVFKPKMAPYVAPNRPAWHITDILAAHKGKADWAQPVVKDRWFNVQYISMGTGQKTPTSFQDDTIIWFVIYSGQVRFTIQGHDPFVATKDFLVQVPMRTPYSMETVGDAPSVRLEVRRADSSQVFPVADNPTPPTAPPGFESVKVEARSPASSPSSAPPTQLYLDYDKEVINNPNPPRRLGFFVRDANGFAVPIRSAPTAVAEDDIGHFHTGLAEFWYVLEGNMDCRIEGIPGLVKAHQGDVVYAPMGRYHRTIMVGSPFSTRLAMGGVADSGASLMPLPKTAK